jgi:hypothetical protein
MSKPIGKIVTYSCLKEKNMWTSDNVDLFKEIFRDNVARFYWLLIVAHEEKYFLKKKDGK